MALAPLCLPASWTLCIYFMPPPKPGTWYHFFKARLGTEKLCVAQVLNIVSLWCWALFKCCLLCVLTSVNCLLSIGFQAGGFFILPQIPPTFIWNSCQWDVSGVGNSRTQELAENAMRIWRGLGQWEVVLHGWDGGGLMISVICRVFDNFQITLRNRYHLTIRIAVQGSFISHGGSNNFNAINIYWAISMYQMLVYSQ